MAARSLHHTITDDLLEVSVRIKRDAGVGHDQIQAVIDQFASKAQWQERTGGIGFPLVEDIPQSQRGAFMATLAELAPQPEQMAGKPEGDRRLSVTEIWPSRIV